MAVKFVARGLGAALFCLLLLIASCHSSAPPPPDEASPAVADSVQLQQTINDYIERWQSFYPSAAFGDGVQDAAARFEKFSDARVQKWLAYHSATESYLDTLPANLPTAEQIDARVLQRQIRLELEKWQQDKVREQQPQWYANLISDALTYVLISERLSEPSRLSAVMVRLEGVDALCRLGIKQLANGNSQRIQAALANLERTVGFYKSELPVMFSGSASVAEQQALSERIESTVLCIGDLSAHINEQVLPSATLPESFGPEAYARKLAIFSDDSLQPEQLAAMALQEIDAVREMMLDLADNWWLKNRQGEARPERQAALTAALDAMEEDRANNRDDFRQSFSDATSAAIKFVADHELATLPENLDVRVELLPEHSPFARIGAVFPPGPFSPSAATLLYLPSIPDAAETASKEGFYRSFNDHFNLMIISHEIFPGHDMQFKIALQHAPMVRSLFSNQYYSEGWASLSEVIMLNAGWANGQELTRLAHLRKRLENAVRAYISVMVHVEGWDERQVTEFATTRGLLPPQFAANLWKRALGLYYSVQLTSYFGGAHEIRLLWDEVKARRGDRFVQKEFVDDVLQTGPVSMRDLRTLLLAE